MAPEIGPKSFGGFEKGTPGQHQKMKYLSLFYISSGLSQVNRLHPVTLKDPSNFKHAIQNNPELGEPPRVKEWVDQGLKQKNVVKNCEQIHLRRLVIFTGWTSPYDGKEETKVRNIRETKPKPRS